MRGDSMGRSEAASITPGRFGGPVVVRTSRLVLLTAGLAISASCASGSGEHDGPLPGVQLAAAPVASQPARTAAMQTLVRAQLDSVEAALLHLERATAVIGDSAHDRAAQRAFIDARRAYKRVEYAIETWAPTAAQALNGPALPRVADDEGDRPQREPEGFQVIEELLFPTVTEDETDRLREEVRNARATLGRVRLIAAQVTFADEHFFDGLRRELARIVSLGLSGFDSPVARLGVLESAEALRGVQMALAPYATRVSTATFARMDSLLTNAIASMERDTAFEAFDRFGFIVAFARPAGLALSDVRRALDVPVPDELRLWRAEAPTPYEVDAWDPMAFAPTDADVPTASLVALGAALFHDTSLSGDGTRSCATCHQPLQAFQDGRARAEPVRGTRAILRNTPTLQHAALQPALHAEGRLAYLEDQARDVVENPKEMAGNLERTAARWSSDAVRRASFARAFGGAADSAAVTSRRIAAALAAYVRSLPVTDAPFDRALRGDSLAISPAARRGFNVYMGKAACGTCHFAPLFNGVVPTRYEEAEYEVIGVPSRAVWRNARIDADSGRGPLNQNPLHAFAFKTPTVRHSARTAPYMHNGVYRTLEEVIRFYNVGGGEAIGALTAHQTLPADPLDLTDAEIADLIAFLKSLD